MVATCSTVAADCQSTPCTNGGSCCMCSCHAGDYIAGSFSCNCDSTPSHKPLPNSKQPRCCGGPYGFDAWCLKQNSTAVTNLRCSNQTAAGVPLPFSDFYEFGLTYRCVYPPATCDSAFCDNLPVPHIDDHICHKP
jgi:hypothetical protein